MDSFSTRRDVELALLDLVGKHASVPGKKVVTATVTSWQSGILELTPASCRAVIVLVMCKYSTMCGLLPAM